MAFTDASDETSTVMVMARKEGCVAIGRREVAAAERAGPLRSQRAILEQPLRARRRVMARPMPEAAPVMRAVPGTPRGEM